MSDSYFNVKNIIVRQNKFYYYDNDVFNIKMLPLIKSSKILIKFEQAG